MNPIFLNPMILDQASYNRKLPAKEFIDWLVCHLWKLVHEGYRLYIFTTTYKNIDDSSFRTADYRLGKWYSTALIPSLFPSHRYHKPKNRARQPIMYAFPDIPGSKRKIRPTPRKRTSTTEGVHHHWIIAALPPISEKLDQLCGKEDSLCLRPFGKPGKRPIIKTSDFEQMDLNRIDRWVSYASNYALFKRMQTEHWFKILGPNISGSRTGEPTIRAPDTHQTSTNAKEIRAVRVPDLDRANNQLPTTT